MKSWAMLPFAAALVASTSLPSIAFDFSDYLKIKNGMTYGEVVSILGRGGTEGSRVDMEGVPVTVVYTWKKWHGANIVCMFQDGKLITKAQAGL